MPLDTRRLTGPEVSQSPLNFCSTSSSLNLDSLSNQRPDGRSASKLRPLFLRAGVVSQARGSGYIEMNNTKAICAVYGPREVVRREDFSLKGQLTCDFKFATFSCKQRRQHQTDNQERDLSVQLLEALEPAVCLHKYPKSQINVYVQVLQNDGCALSAATICASVALASAGLEMYDMVVASSIAIHGPLSLVDPTSQEEEAVLNQGAASENNAGSVTVAFLPSVNQVSAVSSDGEVKVETLKTAIQTCVSNCQKLYPVLQQTLTQHIKEKRKEHEQV